MTCFSELLGKTITNIDGVDIAYSHELFFHCNDGSVYRMYHSQDCCESVSIEEVIGDTDGILNTPILLAEEIIYDNEPNPDGNVGSDDYCWTFYKLRTISGDVTIRWLGESNGYYSISVDFIKVE